MKVAALVVAEVVVAAAVGGGGGGGGSSGGRSGFTLSRGCRHSRKIEMRLLGLDQGLGWDSR